MNFSLNFYLDRVTKDSASTDLKFIYYYITWDGDRLRKSTGFKCRICDWIDTEEKRKQIIKVQRITTKVEYSLKINSELSDIEYRVEKFFESCDKENRTPSKLEVESAATGKLLVEEEKEFKPLFNKFINDSETGIRRTKKGKKIKPLTIKSYNQALSILEKFEKEKKVKLEWKNINDRFYHRFTEYMWEDLNYYDNAVGSIIKVVHAFLNWCVDEKYLQRKLHNSTWIVWEEEIDIIVLYPDELKLLFNSNPPTERLQRTKDIFLAGCMTCLRVTTLLELSKQDLNGNKLKVITKGDSVVHLEIPPLLKEIFNKYEDLLPKVSQQKFNDALKDLAKWFAQHIKDNKDKLPKDFIGNDWGKDIVITRYKRGKPIKLSKPITDMITSHTMRRTGITSLLMMGLSEVEVKSISGHSLNSDDFPKYVKIAERFISKKSADAWGKIAKK
jgi:integrase